jgi:hypothetical protein
VTFLWLVDAGHDPQKCRFSRAIYADHPDPVTFGDRKRKAFKEHSADSADRHLFQIDEDAHEVARLPALEQHLGTLRLPLPSSSQGGVGPKGATAG